MTNKPTRQPIAMAVGAVLVASLTSSTTYAEVSDQGFVDFGATTLSSACMQLAKADEGKCGGGVGGIQAWLGTCAG